MNYKNPKTAPLTERQKLFCQEYLKSMNGKAAAEAAGYSTIKAEVRASSLLKVPSVRRYLKKLTDARQRRLEISAERIDNEFARIAFANLKDFRKALKEGGLSRVLSKLTRNQAACISSIIQRSNQHETRVELKFHDKLKALEALCRRYGLFDDKLRVSQDNQAPRVTISDLDLSLEDKRRILQAIRAAQGNKQAVEE